LNDFLTIHVQLLFDIEFTDLFSQPPRLLCIIDSRWR